MAGINLTGVELGDIVSAAIVQSMTEDNRNILIQGALKHLITEQPSSGYSSRPQPSPLQEAFNSAIRTEAHRFLLEYMKTDTQVQDSIKSLVSEAFTKLMTTNRVEIVDKIVDAIGKGLEVKY